MMMLNNAWNRTNSLSLRTFGLTAQISQVIDGASELGLWKTKKGVLQKLPEARREHYVKIFTLLYLYQGMAQDVTWVSISLLLAFYFIPSHTLLIKREVSKVSVLLVEQRVWKLIPTIRANPGMRANLRTTLPWDTFQRKIHLAYLSISQKQ